MYRYESGRLEIARQSRRQALNGLDTPT